MEKQGGGEDHLFLGEPEWESLPRGRVRCVQTGHEMPLAAQPTYASTKKCRSALFEAALKKRTPPLNFFDQSPAAKDKIICKLTGVVLNKKEDAVWRHMLGKKFEQKLAEKEEEKKSARKDVEMTGQGVETPGSQVVVNNGRVRKKEKASAAVPSEINGKGEVAKEDDDDDDDNSSDHSDFWAPPEGQRWDFDAGGDDRWVMPAPQDDPGRTAAQAADHSGEPTVLESRPFPANDGDTEMLDGEEPLHEGGSSDDSEEVKIRMKRTSTAPNRRSQKKAKRLIPESMKQNGF